MTLLDAALHYAQRGFAVFPLKPRDKKPVTPNGFKNATRVARPIEAWWALDASRNIGIATGEVSGIVVIDIDGEAAREEWAALKGSNEEPVTLTSITGRAEVGHHLLFQHPGFHVGNSDLSPHINVRADGGYIVAPPSLHPDTGKAYAWLDETAEIAPLPGWLLEALEMRGNKPTTTVERSLPAVASARPTIKYAETALDGEVNAVKSAGEGNRNNQLNTSAFNLGQLVGSGTLDRYTVEDHLINAALGAGLSEDEARKTIKSGLDSGIKQPRMIKPRTPTAQPDLKMEPLGSDAEGFAETLAKADTIAESAFQTKLAALPQIQVNGIELRDTTAASIDALARCGSVFVRSGELARVRIDERNRAGIESIGESALRGRMARAANYYSRKYSDKNGWTETVVAPPIDVVRDVMTVGDWPFAPLDGVIEAPSIRPDGSILNQPGYDPATRLFLVMSPGLELPNIPDAPGREEVDAALELLSEIFIDMPFEDQASRANALAALLTPIARPMINGPVPMSIFDSPQQSNGKTLAAQLVGVLATGEMPEPSPAPDAPEEWRKSISAQLGAARSVILIDNVTRTLEDGSLAAALTSITWSDRLLGRNDKQIRLPARACWMATGNNVQVGGDLVTRTYLIRLDAKMSRPQEREGFKYPQIEAWVKANRGLLLKAALVLCRAWHAAGRPAPTCPRMRYDEWRNVIGGILEFAGVNDFLGNLRSFQEAGDIEGSAWERFILQLIDTFGPTVSPGLIYARFASSDDLAAALPPELSGLLGAPEDLKARSKFSQRAGCLFRNRVGKRHGDSQACIVGASRHAAGMSWLLKTGE